MMRYVGKFTKAVVIFLLFYLIILIGGFFGIQKGLTNTDGAVDGSSEEYEEMAKIVPNEFVIDKNVEELDAQKRQILCKIDAIGEYAPVNAEKIIDTYLKTNSGGLVNKMIFAVDMRLRDNQEFRHKFSQCGEKKTSIENLAEKFRDRKGNNAFPWMNAEEWAAIREATVKDKDVINRVAQETQLPPRLIVSSLIVEQLRLFHSQRELFKKFFEPLKILGNATKISLGVMGIKEATAIQTEEHLKNPNSPYYLGKSYENMLNFSTDDVNQERFNRLTDGKNHYYSYLYGALYIKQMMSQWEMAGYDIRYRPEIIVTLFNVGFPQSKPKAEPKVGGSEINVGEAKYSFGSLGYEFYYSGEMEEEFPYVVK